MEDQCIKQNQKISLTVYPCSVSLRKISLFPQTETDKGNIEYDKRENCYSLLLLPGRCDEFLSSILMCLEGSSVGYTLREL